jgi:hypothetical protein
VVKEFHPDINMLLFVGSLGMQLINERTLLSSLSGDPDIRGIIVPICGFRGY